MQSTMRLLPCAEETSIFKYQRIARWCYFDIYVSLAYDLCKRWVIVSCSSICRNELHSYWLLFAEKEAISIQRMYRAFLSEFIATSFWRIKHAWVWLCLIRQSTVECYLYAFLTKYSWKISLAFIHNNLHLIFRIESTYHGDQSRHVKSRRNY